MVLIILCDKKTNDSECLVLLFRMNKHLNIIDARFMCTKPTLYTAPLPPIELHYKLYL